MDSASGAREGGGAGSGRGMGMGTCAALSSIEAEYIAFDRWQRNQFGVNFLRDLGISIHDAMVVNANNQGSISLIMNPVFHNHSSTSTFSTISPATYPRKDESVSTMCLHRR